MSFSNLGGPGTLTIATASGRSDTLIYNGTAANDSFTVRALLAGGEVLLNNQIDVVTPGVANLTLNGLAGDNQYLLTASAAALPYTNIVVNGSGTPDPDSLALVGNGTAVTVNVGTATPSASGGGLGSVSISGVGIVNLNAGTGTVAVNGTSGADSITVTPIGAASATFQANGVVPIFNLTNVSSAAGAFTVNGNGGSDQVFVEGTQGDDKITATGALVSVNTLLGVNIAAIGHLELDGLAGNDTFDLTPSAGVSLFADGGDPIGTTPGDQVILHPVGVFAVEPGPTNDAGGLKDAGQQRVSWSHMESVTVIGGPGAGPALVTGTNGDDDITVIARDGSYNPLADGVQDFTVAVNGGPDVLYINAPALFIDALAGDDQVVVREPAVNQAVWNVQVFVAGGTPGAASGQLGDTLELETPGSQSVTYSPDPALADIPNPAPGVVTFPTPSPLDTFLFNDTNNTSHIVATQFSINVANLFSYTSSPGGVEQAVYQGGASGGPDNLTFNTPANGQLGNGITYIPGAARDAGSIQSRLVGGVPLVPLTFTGLGAAATITFTNATTNPNGRTDILNLDGTSSADAFQVLGAANGGQGTAQILQPGLNNIFETVLLNTNAIAMLALHGLGGVDTFSLAGTLPYTSTIIDADATVNLTGATGPVTVNIADSATGANTTVTGYGGVVNLMGVDTVNLDLGGGLALAANGYSGPNGFTYQPTSPSAGTFTDAGVNTTFNFANATSTFTLNGQANTADQATVLGTNNSDFILVDSPNRRVTVENAAGTDLKPVILGSSVENLQVNGKLGSDTFYVVPAPATATGTGGGAVTASVPTNLLIDIEGGPVAGTEELVVGNFAYGAGANPVFAGTAAALPATDFVANFVGTTPATGVLRDYRSLVQLPDITYHGVGNVAPLVAKTTINGVANQPQLVNLGPDNYEPNDSIANSYFLGAGSAINVQRAAIFPNVLEHRFAPADQDFYRVVAQTTGTLDFQVYFNLYPGLLPAGGNLNIEAFDAAGDVIASSVGGPATFGAAGAAGNDRIRIPAVAGQTYYLEVFGASAEGGSRVINGYNMTVVNTAPPTPFNLELSRSVLAVTLTSGGSGYATPPAVTVTGGGGSGATAIAVLGTGASAGKVVAITITNPGSGYTTPPSIGFSSGTAAATASIGDTGDLPKTAANDDTGRSQFDNVTNDNKPTIYIRLNDGVLLNDLPGNSTPSNPPVGTIPITLVGAGVSAGYRVAIFDGDNSQAPVTPTAFATQVAGFPGLYQYTFTTPLADGVHHIHAAVQMVDPATPTVTGFGSFNAVSLDLTIDTAPPPVNFGPTYGVNGDGLAASSDSGVNTVPDAGTLSERITNVSSPTFFGTAEANSIIQIFAVTSAPGAVTPYVLLAQTTAVPLDGTNADPNGYWSMQSGVNMNDQNYFAPRDGERQIFVVATDLAGNTTPQPGQPGATAMNIFVDTTGPQIGNIQITGSPAFNLFGVKPSNQLQGPTPLVKSLTITVQDGPGRNADFLYNAIEADLASTPGAFLVAGDQVGNVAITSVNVINNPPVSGQPATATVQLTFGRALPDDRYTITINAANIVDPAGNLLDGESNGVQPLGIPTFPSGDGNPGGNFTARFTVDSRPHIGIDGNGIQELDVNGNGIWDPTNAKDATNSDKAFAFGLYTDNLLAGNFAPAGQNGNGFDKLGVYGVVNGQFRFMLATSGITDGVLTPSAAQTLQINGLPVAYHFNPAISADEVAVFDGHGNWYIDYTHTNNITSASMVIHDGLSGYPVVGDFDGSGHFELATYQPDTNTWQFDLTPLTHPGITTTFRWGFAGVQERPVAKDMNQDGVTDIGLYVPVSLSSAITPGNNWFFLVSQGTPVVGTINTLNHAFSPLDNALDPGKSTSGNDLYFTFGNGFFQPIVGIWDPPAASTGVDTTPLLPAPTGDSGPHGTIATNLPTFTWNSVTGASSYEVWLTDQTTGLTVTPTVAGTTWTPTQALNIGDNYTWWVGPVNTNGSISWSAAVTFNIAPTANTVSGTVTTLQPIFTWGSVSGAASYQIWLADRTTGQTVSPIITDSSWTPAQPLNVGDNYTWWVGAVSVSGTIGWSSGQSFSVAAVAASLSGTIATTSPSFTWTGVAGVSSYQIWLTDQTTGQTLAPTVTGTTWTPSQALNLGDRYTWWIGTIGTSGKIAWSSGQTFSIGIVTNGPSGTIATNLPTFAWTSLAGISSYEIWLTDQTTGKTVTPIVTGTSWAPSSGLRFGDNYVWWVGAIGAGGKISWSGAQYFTIAPTVSGPGGTSASGSFAFSWSSVIGASSYQVWLTDQTTGQTVTPIVTGTTWTPTQSLIKGHKYIWWVGVVDIFGSIGWDSAQTILITS